MAGGGYGSKTSTIPAVKGARAAAPIAGARAKAALTPEGLRTAFDGRMQALERASAVWKEARKEHAYLVASKASKKKIAAARARLDQADRRKARLLAGRDRVVNAYESRTGRTLAARFNARGTADATGKRVVTFEQAIESAA